MLIHLGYHPEKDKELFDATSAFMGGTLFMGRTCSAFTTGVMAIGLRTGEIEDSPLRVIRLLTIMTIGGDAFDQKINKFNRSYEPWIQAIEDGLPKNSAAPNARRSHILIFLT